MLQNVNNFSSQLLFKISQEVKVKQESIEESDALQESSSEVDQQEQQNVRNKQLNQEQQLQQINHRLISQISEPFNINASYDQSQQLQDQIIPETNIKIQQDEFKNKFTNLEEKFDQYYCVKDRDGPKLYKFNYHGDGDYNNYKLQEEKVNVGNKAIVYLYNSMLAIYKDQERNIVLKAKNMHKHIQRQIINSDAQSILYINVLQLQKQLVKEYKTMQNTLYACKTIINDLIKAKFENKKYILLFDQDIYDQKLYQNEEFTYQDNIIYVLQFLKDFQNQNSKVYILKNYNYDLIDGTIFTNEELQRYKLEQIESDVTFNLQKFNINFLDQYIDIPKVIQCYRYSNELLIYTILRQTGAQVNCYMNLQQNCPIVKQEEDKIICSLQQNVYIISDAELVSLQIFAILILNGLNEFQPGVCESCLNGSNYRTYFYCVEKNMCMTMDQLDQCQNREMHDLILNATHCCHTFNQLDCLNHENINFCTWCPEHQYNDEFIRGKCLYKDDIENLRNNCHTASEITSPCSIHKDCISCSKDLPCSWCSTKKACVTALYDNQYYFSDNFNCKENEMRYDKQSTLCVCKGNKYISQNENGLDICLNCPMNTTVNFEHTSCLCNKENSEFNKQSLTCDCMKNSYYDVQLQQCILCPIDSIASNNTCDCLEDNRQFDTTIQKCVCQSPFVEVRDVCQQCPKNSKYKDNTCVCKKNKQYDSYLNKCV